MPGHVNKINNLFDIFDNVSEYQNKKGNVVENINNYKNQLDGLFGDTFKSELFNGIKKFLTRTFYNRNNLKEIIQNEYKKIGGYIQDIITEQNKIIKNNNELINEEISSNIKSYKKQLEFDIIDNNKVGLNNNEVKLNIDKIFEDLLSKVSKLSKKATDKEINGIIEDTVLKINASKQALKQNREAVIGKAKELEEINKEKTLSVLQKEIEDKIIRQYKIENGIDLKQLFEILPKYKQHFNKEPFVKKYNNFIDKIQEEIIRREISNEKSDLSKIMKEYKKIFFNTQTDEEFRKKESKAIGTLIKQTLPEVLKIPDLQKIISESKNTKLADLVEELKKEENNYDLNKALSKISGNGNNKLEIKIEVVRQLTKAISDSYNTIFEAIQSVISNSGSSSIYNNYKNSLKVMKKLLNYSEHLDKNIVFKRVVQSSTNTSIIPENGSTEENKSQAIQQNSQNSQHNGPVYQSSNMQFKQSNMDSLKLSSTSQTEVYENSAQTIQSLNSEEISQLEIDDFEQETEQSEGERSQKETNNEEALAIEVQEKNNLQNNHTNKSIDNNQDLSNKIKESLKNTQNISSKIKNDYVLRHGITENTINDFNEFVRQSQTNMDSANYNDLSKIYQQAQAYNNIFKLLPEYENNCLKIDKIGQGIQSLENYKDITQQDLDSYEKNISISHFANDVEQLPLEDKAEKIKEINGILKQNTEKLKKIQQNYYSLYKGAQKQQRLDKGKKQLKHEKNKNNILRNISSIEKSIKDRIQHNQVSQIDQEKFNDFLKRKNEVDLEDFEIISTYQQELQILNKEIADNTRNLNKQIEDALKKQETLLEIFGNTVETINEKKDKVDISSEEEKAIKNFLDSIIESVNQQDSIEESLDLKLQRIYEINKIISDAIQTLEPIKEKQSKQLEEQLNKKRQKFQDDIKQIRYKKVGPISDLSQRQNDLLKNIKKAEQQIQENEKQKNIFNSSVSNIPNTNNINKINITNINEKNINSISDKINNAKKKLEIKQFVDGIINGAVEQAEQAKKQQLQEQQEFKPQQTIIKIGQQQLHNLANGSTIDLKNSKDEQIGTLEYIKGDKKVIYKPNDKNTLNEKNTILRFEDNDENYIYNLSSESLNDLAKEIQDIEQQQTIQLQEQQNPVKSSEQSTKLEGDINFSQEENFTPFLNSKTLVDNNNIPIQQIAHIQNEQLLQTQKEPQIIINKEVNMEAKQTVAIDLETFKTNLIKNKSLEIKDGKGNKLGVLTFTINNDISQFSYEADKSNSKSNIKIDLNITGKRINGTKVNETIENIDEIATKPLCANELSNFIDKTIRDEQNDIIDIINGQINNKAEQELKELEQELKKSTELNNNVKREYLIKNLKKYFSIGNNNNQYDNIVAEEKGINHILDHIQNKVKERLQPKHNTKNDIIIKYLDTLTRTAKRTLENSKDLERIKTIVKNFSPLQYRSDSLDGINEVFNQIIGLEKNTVIQDLYEKIKNNYEKISDNKVKNDIDLKFSKAINTINDYARNKYTKLKLESVIENGKQQKERINKLAEQNEKYKQQFKSLKEQYTSKIEILEKLNKQKEEICQQAIDSYLKYIQPTQNEPLDLINKDNDKLDDFKELDKILKNDNQEQAAQALAKLISKKNKAFESEISKYLEKNNYQILNDSKEKISQAVKPSIEKLQKKQKQIDNVFSFIKNKLNEEKIADEILYDRILKERNKNFISATTINNAIKTINALKSDDYEKGLDVSKKLLEIFKDDVKKLAPDLDFENELPGLFVDYMYDIENGISDSVSKVVDSALKIAKNTKNEIIEQNNKLIEIRGNDEEAEFQKEIDKQEEEQLHKEVNNVEANLYSYLQPMQAEPLDLTNEDNNNKLDDFIELDKILKNKDQEQAAQALAKFMVKKYENDKVNEKLELAVLEDLKKDNYDFLNKAKYEIEQAVERSIQDLEYKKIQEEQKNIKEFFTHYLNTEEAEESEIIQEENTNQLEQEPSLSSTTSSNTQIIVGLKNVIKEKQHEVKQKPAEEVIEDLKENEQTRPSTKISDKKRSRSQSQTSQSSLPITMDAKTTELLDENISSILDTKEPIEQIDLKNQISLSFYTKNDKEDEKPILNTIVKDSSGQIKKTIGFDKINAEEEKIEKYNNFVKYVDEEILSKVDNIHENNINIFSENIENENKEVISKPNSIAKTLAEKAKDADIEFGTVATLTYGKDEDSKKATISLFEFGDEEKKKDYISYTDIKLTNGKTLRIRDLSDEEYFKKVENKISELDKARGLIVVLVDGENETILNYDKDMIPGTRHQPLSKLFNLPQKTKLYNEELEQIKEENIEKNTDKYSIFSKDSPLDTDQIDQVQSQDNQKSQGSSNSFTNNIIQRRKNGQSILLEN